MRTLINKIIIQTPKLKEAICMGVKSEKVLSVFATEARTGLHTSVKKPNIEIFSDNKGLIVRFLDNIKQKFLQMIGKNGGEIANTICKNKSNTESVISKIPLSECLNKHCTSKDVAANQKISYIINKFYDTDYEKMERTLKLIYKDGKLDTKELDLTYELLSKQITGSKFDKIILGYDSFGAADREYMRERILQQCRLGDADLQLNAIDKGLKAQLNPNSKYYVLGQQVINKKTNQPLFIFENLREVADGNGLRSKNPLCGGKKSYMFKLKKLKNNGIKTIIDFRDGSLCSEEAKVAMKEIGLDYYNFQISSKWTEAEVKNISDYIKWVNKGDFIAGCANGQARTDLAMAINYIFNPNAVNCPKFYYGNVSRSSSVSIRENIEKIYNVICENKDIAKSFGWENFESLEKNFKLRYTRLLNK